ncbi:MAG: ANL family adenylate-forming protein [Sulfurifustis sp.]
MTAKPFIERVRSFGARPALYTSESSQTYVELGETIRRQQSRLDVAGIAPKATVFLQGDYSFDNIALLLALYQNGNIVALNTVEQQKEMADKITAADPEFVIDASGVRAREPAGAPQPLIQRLRDQSHAGLVLFSSGTTGRPKAMLHDLDNLADAYLARRPKQMNILLFLLFDHIGGINTLLSVLAMGAAATLPHERTPESVCALVERRRVVVLPVSPTFLNLLFVSGVLDRYDLSSLRMITYGTEPMPESLLHKLKRRFPKVKLHQTFGTSETGIINTASRSSDSLFMKFDDAGIEYKIVDGELWLRSRRQILGYLNAAARSESFTADGWFRTGDLVDQSEDGYLRIRGRSKELINVGGEKVFPAEVESVVLQLPFVRDCRVYGRPNAITGQSVCADVVLAAPDEAARKALLREIKSFAQANLDPYKVPTRVYAVEQIPYSTRFKKTLPADSVRQDSGEASWNN